jgi:uncharacterized protein (DUF1697 family)
MAAVISLLRAVNLGSYQKIKMDTLRALYESLEFKNVQTYVQSGNVVFTTAKRNLTQVGRQIEHAIEETFGFRPDVILRTPSEMRDVVARNPFASRDEIHPSRLLITFLAGDPGEEARDKVRALKIHPEELHIHEREMFVYFPNGAGRSKLPIASIERALKMPGTARNWNSVLKLLEMAESLERSRSGSSQKTTVQPG